jgi:hypothetical protein
MSKQPAPVTFLLPRGHGIVGCNDAEGGSLKRFVDINAGLAEILSAIDCD